MVASTAKCKKQAQEPLASGPPHRPKKVYSICAAECHHHVRWQKERPAAGEGYNLDTPYCRKCQRSVNKFQRWLDAREAYKHWQDTPHNGSGEPVKRGRKKALRELVRSRVALENDRIYYGTIENVNLSLTQENSEDTMIGRDLAKKGKAPDTPKKQVRFDERQTHRPEGDYRHRKFFSRSSAEYKPGLHACCSKDGWCDTSGFHEYNDKGVAMIISFVKRSMTYNRGVRVSVRKKKAQVKTTKEEESGSD